jgi:soluble lytic murein transglycosylase-like protein
MRRGICIRLIHRIFLFSCAVALSAPDFRPNPAPLAEYDESAPNIVWSVDELVGASLPLEHQHLRAIVSLAVLSAAAKHGTDPYLILAMIQTESQFRPFAIGRHGERGLMQIRPRTAKWIAAQSQIEWRGGDELFDPYYNIQLGVAYLVHLRMRFPGPNHDYLSAYNMGALRVRRLLAHSIQPSEYQGRILRSYGSFYAALPIDPVQRTPSAQVRDL